jgi:hypothetical protein
MKIPNVWNEPFSGFVTTALKNEAARLFRLHQLPADPQEWQALRPRLRERIWQALSVRPPHDPDLDYRETGSIAMEGYTVRNICYRSREDFYVTGNLYVPDGKGPFPGVLSMHGHWPQGRLAERVQCRGHTLAKNGYVCLAVDAFGSGERTTAHGEFEYHGEMLGASLWNIGESLMGIQLVDNMRGIDLLTSLDFVRSDRIGATGASGGGNQTMWLAAMDERVTASVPVASVGTFESYVGGSNCVCETLPGGLTFMEEAAVLALAAPNAVKICSCLGEIYGAFSPKEMMRSFQEARKVFQGLGVDGNLSYQVFNHPHGYWPEIREAMLGWFDLHLRGIGLGAPKAESPFQCIPEEDLMVFPAGERDERAISIAEYCRRKGAGLRERAAEASPPDSKQKAIELAAILRTGESLKKKALHEYPSRGDGWKRFALETQCGRMIPLLLREPSASRTYFLLAGTTGKQDLTSTEMFREIWDSGAGVALIDLWGTGETEGFDNACASVYHDLSRSCLWLGRTLLGEWVRDYALAASVLGADFQADKITLAGHKEAGLAALFCSAVSGLNFPVVLEDSPHSYIFRNQQARSEPRTSFYSMALHVPGILNWGDIPLAESLAGGNVRWINPRLSDGEKCEDNTVDS